jgi:hypothetical protein
MPRTQRILLLLYRVLCRTNAQDECAQLLCCGMLAAQAAPTHCCILPGPQWDQSMHPAQEPLVIKVTTAGD